MKVPMALAIAALLGMAGGAALVGQLGYDLFPDAGGHGAWYASRAAGLAAYLAVWGSLVTGLLMSSAWLDGFVGRARLLAWHQALALTGLALGAGHALLLIPDGFTSFGLLDIAVPFASYYEPALAGLGAIALYMFALVSFSFWFRNRIGMRMWRTIHLTSLLAYVAALWHGVQMGSDSGEVWVAGMYVVTFALLAGALTTRLTYVRPSRSRAQAETRAG